MKSIKTAFLPTDIGLLMMKPFVTYYPLFDDHNLLLVYLLKKASNWTIHLLQINKNEQL